MDGADASANTGRVTSVESFLAHYGVKGMKWGVRKGKAEPKLVLTKKLKSGDSVSIYEHPPSLLGRAISRMSGKPDQFKAFKLTDKDGKKVGDASFRRKSQDELYLNWIGIKPKHRGKGYASAALKGAVKYAQSEGVKKLTLEVPGNAPDARHIYEKLGFKDAGPMQGSKNDIWGGLYPMEMAVPKTRVRHAEEDLDQWEEDFADEFAQFLIENFGTKGEEVEHMSAVDDFLAHYGVKGMKWGVRRKSKGPASADAERKASVKTQAKKSGVQTLSNKDLQDAITRMNLEQQFKRLSVNEKPVVSRFIASTLLEIGKREVQTAVAKKVAGAVARKAVTGGAG